MEHNSYLLISPHQIYKPYFTPWVLHYHVLEWVTLGPGLQDISIHHATQTTISWSPPNPPYLKLNTDGSPLLNPGSDGICSIFRNFEGQWIASF